MPVFLAEDEELFHDLIFDLGSFLEKLDDLGAHLFRIELAFERSFRLEFNYRGILLLIEVLFSRVLRIVALFSQKKIAVCESRVILAGLGDVHHEIGPIMEL